MHKLYLLFPAVLLFLSADSSAQTTVKTDSTNAKVFGGSGQYNKWSLGLNVGVVSPIVAIGGVHDHTDWKAKLGYGASLRWQLAHSFGLQLDAQGGKVGGTNQSATGGTRDGMRSYDTRFWSGTLSGVVNVANVNFLRRENAINFFVSAGGGMLWYNPTYITSTGTAGRYLNANGSNHYIKSLVIPIGAGVKFKLSDALALNLGYTMNFTDDDQLDALKRGYPSKDKYSYGYGGLAYTFGPRSKPNLDWVNPVAMLSDELHDKELRLEIEALKGRIANIENAANDLKKDSDGDGVGDQFDKCPATPAGTVVDGAGCPINFPKSIDTVAAPNTGNPYTNIQFDFDSSVLTTSSYATLDALSLHMRSTPNLTVQAVGYVSSPDEGKKGINKINLSKNRANAVKAYLIRSGVAADRITTRGLGQSNPIVSNVTEEGRIVNRRVQFNFNIPQRLVIIFNNHNADLLDDNKPQLDPFIEYLRKPNTRVILSGQTNWTEISLGERRANRNIDNKISTDRANAVKSYLINKGISAAKITTIALGRQPRTRSSASTTSSYASVIVEP